MSDRAKHGESAMLEFCCQDVGVACKQVTRASTAEDLVGLVAEHAKSKHGVDLNSTLIDYAITKVHPASG